METNIYEVTLEIYTEQTDMDMCAYWEWEIIFNDLFATKRAAIRVCQSKFSKQPLNDYVKKVHAQVCRLTITDKGATGRKRIYNQFKEK